MVTINITKVSVIESIPKVYVITLNLKVSEGEKVLIEQSFTENHKLGNNTNYTINKFRKKMQEVIDKYKSEQNILNSAQLDSAIIVLEGGLIWQ